VPRKHAIASHSTIKLLEWLSATSVISLAISVLIPAPTALPAQPQVTVC
jgi:hypothetical protein